MGPASKEEPFRDTEEDIALLNEEEDGPRELYSPPKPKARRWPIALAIALSIIVVLAAAELFFQPIRSRISGPEANAGEESEVSLAPGIPANHFATFAPCKAVPAKVLATLESFSEPSIHILSGGRLLNPGQNIQVPSEICVIVAIPQTPLPDVDPDYIDPPVPHKGPDSIHLLINTTDVTLTFPPLRPLRPDTVGSVQSILYYAETSILQGGTYTVYAENEFTHWKWGMGWHLKYGPQPFRLATGQLPDKTFDAHEFHPSPLPQVQFTVDGPNTIPPLPVCNYTNIPSRGRWYRKDAFPELSTIPADETGYIWQGDTCLLDYFNPADTASCLANRQIHVYGDSMTRRLTKMIINAGNWCHNLTSKCQDEDERPGVPLTKMVLDDLGTLEWETINRDSHMFDHENITAIPFGRNTTLSYQFIETITNVTSKYMVRFFEPEDLVHVTPPLPDMVPDYDPKPDAKARVDPRLPKADAVLLGFGAWDQAFTDRADPYETNLRRFRDFFLQAYGPETPILLRTANSFCCRSTGTGFRRFTGGRTQEFDDRTRRVFGIDMDGGRGMTEDGRVRVIDITNMNGRPDIIFGWGRSDANHPRASHARIEMQMVLHSLCERDAADGVVKFKERVF